jgi:type IV pilus assembly protein PilC
MIKLRKKTFQWQGIDSQQEQQQGTIESDTLAQARIILLANDITPTHIKQNKKTTLKKIKNTAITHFLKQLITLLKSNIPLQKALALCEQAQDQTALTTLIHQIQQDIQQGSSLSNTLAKYSTLFDNVLLNLIKVGEQTGHLNLVLEKTLHLRQQLEASKNKLKKALTYPCAIVAVSISVSLLMLLLIIPQFEQVFSDFGATLPTTTQFVLTISTLLKHHSALLLLLLTLLGLLTTLSYRFIPTARHLIHRLQLHIPLLSTLLNHTYQSRIYYLLAMTTLSKLTIPNALLLIADHLTNSCYQRACLSMHEHILAGKSLHQGMSFTQHFPNMDCHMIAIAEESGQLASMLQHLSDAHQQHIDDLIDNLGNLLEPCMMIIIGLIIGGLVITMYLPIFNMGNIIN